MAAFQRRLQSIFILEILDYTYFTFLAGRHVKEERIFMDFFKQRLRRKV